MWVRQAAAQVDILAEVCDGRKAPPPYGLLRRRRMIVINYDIVPHWLPWLKSLNPQALILDEIQNLQSRSSNRTIACRELARQTPHILGLSGTALTNRPADLWQPLNIIWPEYYNAFLPYAMDYCKPDRRPWGWEYKGAKNLDKLHKELTDLGMIRRRKIDVLTDLAPLEIRMLPMELTDRGQYDEALHDFISWVAKVWGDKRAIAAAKAERMVKMGYLRRLASRLKMPNCVEWVDNFLAEGKGKLVVFAIHTGLIQALHRRYPRRSVVIDGSITGNKRQAAVDQFRSDHKIDLCIANILAGGTGIDGLQVAQDAAFLELEWRPGIHAQAQARIDRIGQTGSATAWYHVAPNTIEEYLCDILQTKRNVIGQVLDGDADVADFDIFDMLQERLTGHAA